MRFLKSGNKYQIEPDFSFYSDGAIQPKNPGGFMGWGFYMQSESNKEILFYFSDSKDKSPENSNNIAEYLGFIEILKFIISKQENNELLDKKIVIHCDSNLVKSQMTGEWRINENSLCYDYSVLALKLIQKLKNKEIYLKHIKREFNTLADMYSRKSLIEKGYIKK